MIIDKVSKIVKSEWIMVEMRQNLITIGTLKGPEWDPITFTPLDIYQRAVTAMPYMVLQGVYNGKCASVSIGH